MENSSTSPPDTGGLQDSAPSPPKAGNPQDKTLRRIKNKQRRKDKGSKTEHDNVNEGDGNIIVSNDTSIPSGEINTPSGIEVSTVGTTNENNSPQSSVQSNHVATSLATKFSAWTNDAAPEEQIEFAYYDTDTSILN
jgi:hypothetical protein